MTEILTDLQEARQQLEAVRSAMADPLKRWSAEPHRRELVPEVVAAFSELIGREAAYQRVLEQVVLDLAERVSQVSEEREARPREEQIADPK
jgi:hypothetical protein